MRHQHVWERVYDEVPYGATYAGLYGGIACAICGEWYEGDEEEDREDGEE